MSTTSLPANETGIISRVGTWDVALASPDDWIMGKLRAMGTVPLGPYFLALDYDSNEYHLIHGTLYQRQIAKGANYEHLGTAYIGSKEQIEWIRKGSQTNRDD